MTILDQWVRILIDDLLAVKPTLRAEDVTPDSSITRDLGFDSLDLAQLASRIRTSYPEFDLQVWLTSALASDVDTVTSMAQLLAGRTPAGSVTP